MVYTTILTGGKDYRYPCNHWFGPEVVHFYRSVAEAERNQVDAVSHWKRPWTQTSFGVGDAVPVLDV